MMEPPRETIPVSRLAVMANNITSATREIGQLNEQLESGVCKSCGQVIGHAEEHREELRLKIQQLERERATQQARQAELKAEQAELKQRGDKLKAQIDAHNAAALSTPRATERLGEAILNASVAISARTKRPQAIARTPSPTRPR